MGYHDGMIWIDHQFYPKLLCRAQQSCATRTRRYQRNCFIHEAQWRGCCRKVAHLPSWLIPNRSRIFFLHKGNLKKRQEGRIIGYHIFKRAEVIAQPEKPLRLPLQRLAEVWHQDELVRQGQRWDGAEIITHRLINGVWIKVNDPFPDPELTPAPECREGQTRKQKCADGTEIITHVCQNGAWEQTQAKCPPPSAAQACSGGDVIIENCDHGTAVSHMCIDGQWQAIELVCPAPQAPETTMFEEERSCGLRLKPSSIYLLDALAADIADAFDQILANERLPKKYALAKTSQERGKILRAGRKLFKETINMVQAERTTQTKLPPLLENEAKLHGELVLFAKPPIFERFPQASFQHILRIDGDKLLTQIAEGVPRPKIFYADHSLASKIATELKTTKGHSQTLLNQILKVFGDELAQQGRLRLPHFGNFKIVQRKARKGRNPQTGAPIDIPAKKVVKFKAFQKLQDKTCGDNQS